MEEEQEEKYQIEEAEENFDNKEFMMQAIDDKATWVLAYASERLLSDKELILKAVKVDGQVLYYASQELRDDKEVVLAAVNNKWIIVKYASKRLRGDKDVALTAINQSEDAKIYLEEEIVKEIEQEKQNQNNEESEEQK